jgi:hypothetical protein
MKRTPYGARAASGQRDARAHRETATDDAVFGAAGGSGGRDGLVSISR